jgi:thiol:disulfide interchange protein
MPAPAPDPSRVDETAAVNQHGPEPHGSSRRTPSWLLLVAGVLLVARIAASLYEARHPEERADLVQWRPLAQAQATALATGKPILFDFTAEWCPPCRAMGRELFADKQGARRIETLFVPVRVLDRTREDGRNPYDVGVLQQRYHIEAFPTLVVVAADGRELGRVEGYPGKAATLQQLTRARAAALVPQH